AEVSGLVELDIDHAIALAEDTRTDAPARFATRTDTGLEHLEGTLHRDDLVPNYLRLDQLYLRTFVAARRYCAGERDHLYW
ncbi:MAG: NUDIX hydrolase, partial [Actinomycetes bacterium]